MKHGMGKIMIDTFVCIPQRNAVCQECGTTYNGPKEQVKCRGCGESLRTVDVRCEKKVPTGTWVVTTMRKTVRVG